jgi:deoxyhypusine monooxygenase
MVRHEAAEALGAVADAGSIALLQQFASDPEPVVAHSCLVALDMLEHERSGAFEYADLASGADKNLT